MEKVTLQTFDDPSPNEQGRPVIGANARFLVTDRDLLWKGERIGKLYVGKEVTFQHNLFRYLLALLIGLALLHLARSDSGDFALDCASFDLRETALSVVDKLQPLARAKGIAVELHVPDELKVDWDAEKMTQLLVLLIENAIKYTPDGGAVIATLADAMEKGVRVLTIEVKDNGIGISPEALPRIFDRFYRQDKARTRQTGGHGLGLAIAKNIVEAGRGTIRADSKEGEGSTFKVRIPLQGQRR